LVAFELQNKYRESAKLDGNEPMGTVKKIAGEKHVPCARSPIIPRFEYDQRGAAAFRWRAQQICLDESLAKLEQRKTHAAALAEAWAIGDLKAIKANYAERGFSKCLKQVPSFDRLVRSSGEGLSRSRR